MARNRAHRFIVGVAGLLLATAVWSGEVSGSSNSDSSTVPAGELACAGRHGGTITVALENETAGWYPPNGLITASGRTVNRLLYGGLTAATPEGTYEPYLAESVTPNEDNTVWTIGLRDGMTFHDGTPFDAEAVVASLKATSHPDAAVGPLFGWIESIDVVDPLTVTITTTEPYATVPLYLAGGLGQIVSPTAVSELGVEAFNSAPVGAGPYRMTEWVRDDHITMERFDDFFNTDQAYADTIIIRPIPDAQARAAALEAGDVDVIVTQAPADIASFRENDEFTLNETPFGVNMFWLNFEHPPLDDLRIRQAIAMAIDKDVLIDLVWNGVGDPANNVFRADSPYYHEVETPPYDPDAARALVEEYTAETGTEPSFALSSYPTATDQALLEAVQQQLADVGISTTVQAATDATAHITNIINGDYDMGGYVFSSFLDPDYEMTRFFPTESFLNINNFGTPEMDAAIAAGRSSTDQAERIESYAEVQEIIAANVAGVPLRNNIYAIVTSNDILGFNEATMPDGSLTLGEYYTPVVLDGLCREG